MSDLQERLHPQFSLLKHLAEIDSTNSWLAQQGRDGAAEFSLVVADQQTAGRGRRQRSWHSPRGNLYLSILLRPKIPVEHAPLLTLMTAGSVAATLDSVCPGQHVAVKWPNDVLVDQKKVCGILAEMAFVGDRIDFIVIGLGVNCSEQRFPGELASRATFTPASRDDVFEALLPIFAADYQRFTTIGPKSLAALRPRLDILGKRVAAGDGTQKVVGIVVELDPLGALIIENSDGRHRVIAGDVDELENLPCY